MTNMFKRFGTNIFPFLPTGGLGVQEEKQRETGTETERSSQRWREEKRDRSTHADGTQVRYSQPAL